MGLSCMLEKFSVKNFKNFRNKIELDFSKVRDYQYNEVCVKDNLLNKIIIYGKNAVGKSNFGLAILDIRNNLLSMPREFMINKGLYRNANSEENEYAEFEYKFKFDKDIVIYRYSKKNEFEIVKERLIINGKQVFYFDFLDKKNVDIEGVSLVNAQDLNWEQFLGTTKAEEMQEVEDYSLSVLRYIAHNTVQPENSVIRKIMQFVGGMLYEKGNSGILKINYSYLREEEKLKKFEKFLNDYGVSCNLVMLEQIDGEKELYFDYKKPLPFFRNMSSGTMNLTKFYMKFLTRDTKPSFIFIDEFDAFYHFELSEKIIRLLENEFDCQVILTSHNTNLLSNSFMRPDCFMILTPDSITSLCDATNRELRQGHNLEKLYKNGEFDNYE